MSENDFIFGWIKKLFIDAASNPILYNCQTHNAEPDWSKFTRLEVGGCVSDDGYTVGGQPDVTAEFWTVYAIAPEPGDNEAITDCKTRADADAVARVLSLISKLPVQ